MHYDNFKLNKNEFKIANLFIKSSSKNVILSENADGTVKSQNRKSFDLFKKFFPDDVGLYDQFYELVIADSEFSEN